MCFGSPVDSMQLSSPEFRAQYIELLQLMVNSTFSERGWWWTGRILEKSMSCLISIYFKDMRMVPEHVHNTAGESGSNPDSNYSSWA